MLDQSLGNFMPAETEEAANFEEAIRKLVATGKQNIELRKSLGLTD